MKFKSVIVLLVIALLFLLVGCKPKSTEIIRTNWEYMELTIYCTGEYSDEPICVLLENDTGYPDRVSMLNIYGKDGWEVISEIAEGSTVRYLLKRPLFH